jgi:hypothetical protein
MPVRPSVTAMRMSWQPRTVRSREDLHPECRALGRLDPDAEDVAGPVRQDRERERDRLAPDGRLIANRDAQRIDEDDRIHRLERALLPGRGLRDHRVGHGTDQVRRHLDGRHLRQEGLDLPPRPPAAVQREHLVVDAGEPAGLLGNEARLKGPGAVARHVDGERSVVGQPGLAAGPMAMIRGVLRLGATRGIAHVVGQLAPERTLHARLLETADGGIELLDGQRALAHKLIENLRGHRGQRRVRRQALAFRDGIGSPHAMPHTQNS